MISIPSKFNIEDLKIFGNLKTSLVKSIFERLQIQPMFYNQSGSKIEFQHIYQRFGKYLGRYSSSISMYFCNVASNYKKKPNQSFCPKYAETHPNAENGCDEMQCPRFMDQQAFICGGAWIVRDYTSAASFHGRKPGCSFSYDQPHCS